MNQQELQELAKTFLDGVTKDNVDLANIIDDYFGDAATDDYSRSYFAESLNEALGEMEYLRELLVVGKFDTANHDHGLFIGGLLALGVDAEAIAAALEKTGDRLENLYEDELNQYAKECND